MTKEQQALERIIEELLHYPGRIVLVEKLLQACNRSENRWIGAEFAQLLYEDLIATNTSKKKE